MFLYLGLGSLLSVVKLERACCSVQDLWVALAGRPSLQKMFVILCLSSCEMNRIFI